MTYVLKKRGQLTMELGVAMARQDLVSCSFFVFLFVVSGQGGTEVDTSAGALSEANTQRRPHSARERERVRGGGFPLLLFCIFLLSRARRHVEMKVMDKGGERVKRGCGLRRAAA